MAGIRIPQRLLDDLVAHAREGAPAEVCGLLAGTSRGGLHVVERAYRIRNAHPRPVGQYLLDPAEQLRATLEVEDELGLDVVGFYHSHPIGPARFSKTDAARATWPGVSYVLVHLAPTVGVLSARFEPERSRFVDEELTAT